MLTLTEAFNKYGGLYARVRIRDTRTGAVRHVYVGNVGVEGFDQLPRWEGSHSIVLLATTPHGPDGVQRMVWVRCGLDGGCRAAGPVFRVNLDRPPYGPSPWILADQRSR